MYLTGTWQVVEAMGRQEGRMCSVTAAHVNTPRDGFDRWSPLVCTVVIHLDVKHLESLHISNILGQTTGLWPKLSNINSEPQKQHEDLVGLHCIADCINRECGESEHIS